MAKQRSRAKDTARASRILRGDEPEVENLRWRARRLEIPRACFRFVHARPREELFREKGRCRRYQQDTQIDRTLRAEGRNALSRHVVIDRQARTLSPAMNTLGRC